MHEYCSVCGLKFEREEGYFLGAMYISYALAIAAISLLAAVLWSLLRWSLPKIVIVSVLVFLPLAPLLAFIARVLWIYLDQAIDPDKPQLDEQDGP